MLPIADQLLELTEAEQAELLRLTPGYISTAANRAFPVWAHEGQLAPGPLADGRNWRTWVLMAGRGFGKTRAGAEWVLNCVRGGGAGQAHPRPLPRAGGEKEGATWSPSCCSSGTAALPGEGLGEGESAQPSRQAPLPTLSPGSAALPQAERERAFEPLRIALVAATVDEARRIMVEGPSGLLACAREDEIVEWAPSRRELIFKNGAIVTLYSGASPEALRGPQHHIAWCDELAKWRHPETTWDMLQFGLRCGALPRALVTTTPKGGCAALSRILADPDTAQTGGSTRQNPHLPDAFIASVERAYGGTRIGREEIDGVLLPDVAGSLWPAKLIEASRGAAPAAEDLRRVVVGVDPRASAAGTCGIVVCGLDADGVGHVLADRTAGGLSPDEWARAVAAAAEAWGADRVVAEQNQGGDMVRTVLRGAGIALPITLVSATRGKFARAEPVAGKFEQGKARLAGRFAELEDQLAGMVPAGYAGPGGSPDRADAMVWALWALLIAPGAAPRVRGL